MAHIFRKVSRRHFAILKRKVLSAKFAIIALILVYSTWILWLRGKYIPLFFTKIEGLRSHEEQNGDFYTNDEAGVHSKRSADTMENSRKQNNVNVLAKTKDTEPNLETGIKPELNTNSNAFYGIGCGQNPYRKGLQKLLNFWNKLTRGRRIDYFICDGTLLGYQRNLDFLPYDHDIDICVNKTHVSTLLKLESKRPIRVKDKRPHLIISKPLANGMRLNCKGILVDTKMDACSIVSPAARVILGDVNFIDVYPYTKGELYSRAPKLQFEISDVYPTKPCWLAGVATRCPSKPESMLEKVYGKNAVQNPSHICIKHQFVAARLDERENELPWSIQRVNRLILKRFKSKRL